MFFIIKKTRCFIRIYLILYIIDKVPFNGLLLLLVELNDSLSNISANFTSCTKLLTQNVLLLFYESYLLLVRNILKILNDKIRCNVTSNYVFSPLVKLLIGRFSKNRLVSEILSQETLPLEIFPMIEIHNSKVFLSLLTTSHLLLHVINNVLFIMKIFKILYFKKYLLLEKKNRSAYNLNKIFIRRNNRVTFKLLSTENITVCFAKSIYPSKESNQIFSTTKRILLIFLVTWFHSTLEANNIIILAINSQITTSIEAFYDSTTSERTPFFN